MARPDLARAARLEQYVAALFERLRFNLENDLPLTMGGDPGAFLEWMGLPPRSVSQDMKRARLGGAKAEAQRARVRDAYMMRRLARKMERTPG